MIHKILQQNDEKLVDDIMRDPGLYYKLVDIVRNVTPESVDNLNKVIAHIAKEREGISKLVSEMNAVASQFHEENIHTTRRKRNHVGMLDTGDDDDDNKYDFRDHNYIILFASVVSTIGSAYGMIHSFAKDLRPPKIITTKKRIDGDPETYEEFNNLYQEMQFNGRSVENYANTLAQLFNSYEAPRMMAKDFIKILEPFYKYLVQTHTRDGNKIIVNPVVTNVAMHIFENIDSNGDTKKGDNVVSAYTLRKAETLANALNSAAVKEFMKDPDKLQYLIRVAITDISHIITELNKALEDMEPKLREVATIRPEWMSKEALPKDALQVLDSIKFSAIVYNEPIQTNMNKLAEKMRNETIETIAQMLMSENVNFQEIVEYVIERKAELNKFFYEENSFYVCKIGEGNPFMGQAPGALYVEPAERPLGKFDEILGSGFQEIRDFFYSIEHTSKFQDLFLATSPSKTADKSNVLMVGPMGCGKTEVLRAVGADKNSIGIFAQGSDFLTCWKGEAEKNPKRLFNEGIKLHRESGRHVHFLIDEIDSLLNNDRDLSGNNNLTMEFQILMDGVVRYPNLSVWGATNHIHRIPMPMIRRFSKVQIVGELNRDERAKLLKLFTSYMPIAANLKEEQWQTWANKLEGATGDVMRKIADYLWRKKISDFVANNAEKAEEMVKFLNMEGKFNVDTFTSEQRDKFKKALASFVTISAKDIDSSINENLLNVGVRSEIKTAIATYKSAKEYLNKAREEMVGEAGPEDSSMMVKDKN